MGGNQQIIQADRLACGFQLGPDSSVFAISRHVQRQNRDNVQNALDPFQKSGRPFFCAAITQLSRHDYASEERLRVFFCNATRGKSGRITDQITDYVRIQKISAQKISSGLAA